MVPGIADQEWDFSGLRKDERLECRAYEFGREIAMRDDSLSDWKDLNEGLHGVYRSQGFTKPPLLKDLVFQARRELGLSPDAFGITSEQKYLLWELTVVGGRWDVLVAFPEWPESPYLTIEEAERLKRLEVLRQPALPELTEKQWADLLLPDSVFEGRRIELVIPDQFKYYECEKAFKAYLRLYFPEKRKYGRARDFGKP